MDVVTSGSYAYATHWKLGLEVVDVSDPLNPIGVGLCEIVDARRVRVSGRYAYVTAANGVHVIDISEPSNPRRVGGNLSFGDAQDFEAEGTQILMAIAMRNNHFLIRTSDGDLVGMDAFNQLRFVPSENGPTIDWDLGTLQFAPGLTGPWTDIPAASPFPLSPIGETGFFRVKVEGAQELMESIVVSFSQRFVP